MVFFRFSCRKTNRPLKWKVIRPNYRFPYTLTIYVIRDRFGNQFGRHSTSLMAESLCPMPSVQCGSTPYRMSSCTWIKWLKTAFCIDLEHSNFESNYFILHSCSIVCPFVMSKAERWNISSKESEFAWNCIGREQFTGTTIGINDDDQRHRTTISEMDFRYFERVLPQNTWIESHRRVIVLIKL